MPLQMPQDSGVAIDARSRATSRHLKLPPFPVLDAGRAAV